MALAERRTLAIEAKLRDLLTGPLTQMEKGMSRFGVVTSRALGIAAVAFGTITAASLAGFHAMLHIAEGLNDIAKASDNLGITAESLTAISNGAQLAGVSIEELGVAMKNFSKVIDEASQGGRQQKETLQRLGIVAEQFQGQQLDVVDVLAKVAEGLRGVDSAAARTRILVDLFGKSGNQLGHLLKGGAAGIKDLVDEALALGVVFSREQLERVVRFKDSFEALQQTFSGLAKRIVVDVAPAFTELFETLRKTIIDKSSEIGIQMARIVGIIIDGMELLTKAVRRLLQIVEGFNAILQFANLVRLSVVGAFEDISGNTAEFEKTNTQIENAKQQFLALVDVLTALDNAGDLVDERFKLLRKSLDAIRATPRVDNLPGTDPKTKVPGPDAWTRYWKGFSDGADKAITKWRDFGAAGAEAATMIVDHGLTLLVDSIGDVIDRTKSIGQAAKDFARQFLSDLGRIIAKLAVMQALQALNIGAEDGGVLPAMSRGGISRFAVGGLNRRGGIATRPTVLFGEGKNAEAFVPLPDNRSIPVSFVGGGPTGGNSLNFFITAMDSKDVQRMLIKEQNTLRAIFQNQIETRVGMRRTIQRVR